MTLTTLMLSTLKDPFFITRATASTTSLAMVSSTPYCLAAITGFTAFNRSVSNDSTFSTTNSSNVFITNLFAKLNPWMISLTFKPNVNNFSATLRNSPARMITRLVLSPISNSCCFDAWIKIFTTGWTISNSLSMVAASLVMNFLPNLLTMILFLPLGPMEVSKIEAISRTASTFLIMAPSALEKEEYPCLNKPEFGACGNFNDIGGQ